MRFDFHSDLLSGINELKHSSLTTSHLIRAAVREWDVASASVNISPRRGLEMAWV